MYVMVEFNLYLCFSDSLFCLMFFPSGLLKHQYKMKICVLENQHVAQCVLSSIFRKFVCPRVLVVFHVCFLSHVRVGDIGSISDLFVENY